jgi:hypothetical protein
MHDLRPAACVRCHAKPVEACGVGFSPIAPAAALRQAQGNTPRLSFFHPQPPIRRYNRRGVASSNAFVMLSAAESKHLVFALQ